MLVSPGPRCYACQRRHDARYAAMRPAHHALYGTAAWRRLAASVTAGATRCTHCLKPTRRLVADHVVPVEKAPELALERSNLTPSCVGCNNRRGRNAKLPELDTSGTPPAGPLRVGDRLAAILQRDEVTR